MGRPKADVVTKIRQQIIALSPEEFDWLLRDMEIIQEIREEAAANAEVKA
jgi:hypothetical protein